MSTSNGPGMDGIIIFPITTAILLLCVCTLKRFKKPEPLPQYVIGALPRSGTGRSRHGGRHRLQTRKRAGSQTIEKYQNQEPYKLTFSVSDPEIDRDSLNLNGSFYILNEGGKEGYFRRRQTPFPRRLRSVSFTDDRKPTLNSDSSSVIRPRISTAPLITPVGSILGFHNCGFPPNEIAPTAPEAPYIDNKNLLFTRNSCSTSALKNFKEKNKNNQSDQGTIISGPKIFSKSILKKSKTLDDNKYDFMRTDVDKGKLRFREKLESYDNVVLP